MSKTKKVTIQDVIDAAEKNGLPYYGDWFQFESGYADSYDGSIVAACVLGQAAINLEVDEQELHMWINRIDGDELLASKIEEYNDRQIYHPNAKPYHRSYKTIIKYLKKQLEDYKDKEATLAIKHYNVKWPEKVTE